jgi:hypothetical protein
MLRQNKVFLFSLIASFIYCPLLYATQLQEVNKRVHSDSGVTPKTAGAKKQSHTNLPPAKPKKAPPAAPSMVEYCRENTC